MSDQGPAVPINDTPEVKERLTAIYKRESRMDLYGTGTLGHPGIETMSPDEWYKGTVEWAAGGTAAETKADLKHQFEQIPKRDGTGLRDLRNLESVREVYGFSYKDMGTTEHQFKEKLNTELTAEAQRNYPDSEAQRNFADAQMRFNYLQTTKYCLEEAGHDMKADATYKLLDHDLTKQKFDKQYGDAERLAGPQAEAGARPSVQPAPGSMRP